MQHLWLRFEKEILKYSCSLQIVSGIQFLKKTNKILRYSLKYHFYTTWISNTCIHHCGFSTHYKIPWTPGDYHGVKVQSLHTTVCTKPEFSGLLTCSLPQVLKVRLQNTTKVKNTYLLQSCAPIHLIRGLLD